MPSVLVTGGRQGLGLEFCRQFAAAKWQVHGTCLDPATAEDLFAVGSRLRASHSGYRCIWNAAYRELLSRVTAL
jgi:NAD(P)-dependent dehydrogenase (short-subunit alcohol dehydrogenase family)